MIALRFIWCVLSLAFADRALADIVAATTRPPRPVASAAMRIEPAGDCAVGKAAFRACLADLPARAQLAQGEGATAEAAQRLGGSADQPPPGEAGAHDGETDAPARRPTDAICEAIAAAAERNDLPLGFFMGLIWQESRFDPAALSPKGARGVAQFMPATASWRGLRDPFDPVEAIPKAAKLLGELRRDFGNLGLAAAAYNAGPRRVRQWLAGRQDLPRETQAYVRLVTGRPAEEWVASAPATSDAPPDVPCRPAGRQLATASARPASAKPESASPVPRFVWGIQVIGSPSEVLALTAWRQLQQKYPSILAGQEPMLIRTRLGARGAYWHRVRIGAITLASANALCGRLRGAGASCLVQRN